MTVSVPRHAIGLVYVTRSDVSTIEPPAVTVVLVIVLDPTPLALYVAPVVSVPYVAVVRSYHVPA